MKQNPKIILFGKTGQLGHTLSCALAALGNLLVFDRQTANFLDPKRIHDLLVFHKPAVIVNATAFTAVEKAETEQQTAYTINAEAVAVLAHYAATTNAWLIHYSTDYVFDGTKSSAYLETDIPNPINVYGLSKLQGEQYILDSGCNGIIIRTSWVYGYHGGNFLRTLLRLAEKKASLQIVDDQIGSPTSVELLADVTTQIIQTNIHHPRTITPGIYHLTAEGETSWYHYAQFFLHELQEHGLRYLLQPEQIQPVNSETYAAIAPRPKNSCLNTKKIQRLLDRSFPSWHSGVQRWVKQLTTELTAYRNHPSSYPRHTIT